MASEPWNKVNIPCPSAISTVQIPFSESVDRKVTRLVKDCDEVLKLLQSKVLQTEVRVLYALLYLLNNSFRQHLPFRAIKQVEQCVNRLKTMKLEEVLQDLIEMCPSKAERTLGKQTGECAVPSQPMLEWQGLKVLGACKLLLCLAQRCTKAFQLTGQHLHRGEFIVLNVVLTSMLSRLWAFSQGLVPSLVALYDCLLELLQVVARSKPMPFLTEFPLPADLRPVLGPSFPAPMMGAEPRRVGGPAVLQRMFREGGGASNRKQPHPQGNKIRKSSKVDLGSAVSLTRPRVFDHLSGFDLKAMLKRPFGRSSQFTPGVQQRTPERKLHPREAAVIGQKKSFLLEVKAASCFGAMATQLGEMIGWCRSRKLKWESGQLRLLQLQCHRMKGPESEGIRMERKVKSMKDGIRRALFPRGASRARPCVSLHALWRRQHCRTTSGPSRTRRCRRRRSRTGGDSHSHSLASHRPHPEELTGGLTEVANQEAVGQGRNCPPSLPPKADDDIDDIFASIGF
ncbi:hypothetical protein AGOR_G00057850 [Albula goreensis]|uniref:Nucleolus and neural progenitor protein-like N-terminal domain-containing protein n=1 Tax=Albula goreensis TaxID=1534307 RepID=A0A8T3DXS3_9TELE|nr:hypothetical protein AGOR_G00057850 [Albula goreensis]